MRLNKNGIPILDDPKQANGITKPRKCLPGRHVFRFKETTQSGYSYFTVNECMACGEVERVEETPDPQLDPWR